MNATTASGRKRTRAASDRADADGNAETDRTDIGPRPRASAAYPEMPASRHHHHHHQQHVQVVTSTAAAAAQLSVKEKQRLCTNCKNHGLRKVWKKHKRYCKYRDCPCPKCMKTAATRKNCAEQTAKRRARQEDEQREQELQLNPDNFQDERPIPYQSDATTPKSCSRQNMSESSQVGRSTPKGTMSPRTSDYDDHDSSSIDIGDGCDGVLGEGDGGGDGGGDGMDVARDDGVDDRSHLTGGSVGKKDIDADSRHDIMSNKIEHVKTILKELVGRTKDFQNLNAFRLFILQHNTYDVDKATMLIKRGILIVLTDDTVIEKEQASYRKTCHHFKVQSVYHRSLKMFPYGIVHEISNECSPNSKYMGPRVKQPRLHTSSKYHQIPHDELNYLDMMTEKSEANAATTPPAVLTAHQQQVHHGRQSVNRPPTSALIGHHHHDHHHHQPSQPPPPQQPPPPSHHQPVQPPHNQQPPPHHSRSGSSLSVTDYRDQVTTPTVIASGGGGVGRRPTVNGSVSNVLGVRPAHQPQAAVLYPRPMYPFTLPLTPPALWHHAQPHFPTAGVTFQPFMEVPPNEWTRHCRLSMFNPELQPEPVNLQQNNPHHRRPEPGRALEIAARLQQDRAAHSRPAPANPPAHDDREQTRHHA